eukprot:GHVO01041155.1.p1 GENE.GHVO01041155.1~~GHVO01041155.1.p1  ORF type:complete len:365 (-),score=70.02 GHVO01041155.1:805-1899(-)
MASCPLPDMSEVKGAYARNCENSKVLNSSEYREDSCGLILSGMMPDCDDSSKYLIGDGGDHNYNTREACAALQDSRYQLNGNANSSARLNSSNTARRPKRSRRSGSGDDDEFVPSSYRSNASNQRPRSTRIQRKSRRETYALSPATIDLLPLVNDPVDEAPFRFINPQDSPPGPLPPPASKTAPLKSPPPLTLASDNDSAPSHLKWQHPPPPAANQSPSSSAPSLPPPNQPSRDILNMADEVAHVLSSAASQPKHHARGRPLLSSSQDIGNSDGCVGFTQTVDFSDVKGVYKNCRGIWAAQWTDEKGQRHTKYFNPKFYASEAEARNEAYLFKVQVIKDIEARGVCRKGNSIEQTSHIIDLVGV